MDILGFVRRQSMPCFKVNLVNVTHIINTDQIFWLDLYLFRLIIVPGGKNGELDRVCN